MTSIRSASEARRVLLCHGDPVIRLGLTVALTDSPYGQDLMTCDAGDDRFEGCLALADVVVACYEYGLAVCTRLSNQAKSHLRTTNVVMVARQDGEQDICLALAAGVKGYLMPDCEINEVMRCIREASNGTRYLCTTAANRVLDSMSRQTLTAREIQVLRCLMDGHVNKRISDELKISIGTVKSHVKSIFAKLGVATRTQAVNLATAKGILVSEHEFGE